MMTTAALALFMKDVRSELRTRYALNALFMFVVTSVSTILFALRSEQPGAQTFAGMFWVVVFFTAMSGLSRSFVSEAERGTSLVLQLVADPSAVLAGKLLANATITVLLTVVVTFLYLITFPSFEIASPILFGTTVILGSFGFASSGTILAAVIAKANVRGTLYPVLAFPVLLPLFMTVMNATSLALEGAPMIEGMTDLQVMVGYILVTTSVSFLLFEFVWKD